MRALQTIRQAAFWAVLTLCAGCSQRWAFSPPARPSPKAVAVAPSTPPDVTPLFMDPAARSTSTAPPARSMASPSEPPRVDGPIRSAPPIARLPDVSAVVPAGATWMTPAPAGDAPTLGEDRPEDPLFAQPDAGMSVGPWWRRRATDLGRETWHDIRCDYRNYYTWPVACHLLYAVAGGSLLANTSLDQDFRDWYQDDVRTRGTDRFASFWKAFGEGEIFLPAWAGLAVAGKLLEDVPVCGAVGEFSMRTTRGYLVGAPPMLFMQYLSGGSRPGETSHDSMWRPFDDNNGVSGHAFIGAVPFITAARMCERKLPRAGFYVLSTFPAWSRVNDDAHYLSQVCLGWWMAYLACRSIDQTETETPCGRFSLVPLAEPNTVGAMAVLRR